MKKLSLMLIFLALFAVDEAKRGIFNVSVTNITENSAEVSWMTDMSVSTELRLGVMQPGGSYIYTLLPKLPIPDATLHVYPISNLTPLTNYRVEAMSFDDAMGDYVPCDDASNPASFTTLGTAGPITELEVFVQSYTIPVNGWTMIWGNTQTISGAAYGRDVFFTIGNGEPGGSPRGIFEPSTVVTDNNGDFMVMFCGWHYGKAKIEVMVEDVMTELEIMILPDKQKGKSKN